MKTAKTNFSKRNYSFFFLNAFTAKTILHIPNIHKKEKTKCKQSSNWQSRFSGEPIFTSAIHGKNFVNESKTMLTTDKTIKSSGRFLSQLAKKQYLQFTHITSINKAKFQFTHLYLHNFICKISLSK